MSYIVSILASLTLGSGAPVINFEFKKASGIESCKGGINDYKALHPLKEEIAIGYCQKVDVGGASSKPSYLNIRIVSPKKDAHIFRSVKFATMLECNTARRGVDILNYGGRGYSGLFYVYTMCTRTPTPNVVVEEI